MSEEIMIKQSQAGNCRSNRDDQNNKRVQSSKSLNKKHSRNENLLRMTEFRKWAKLVIYKVSQEIIAEWKPSDKSRMQAKPRK